jgi:hypothetical protein
MPLVCPYCNLDHTIKGKPFTFHGLKAHVGQTHPGKDQPTEGQCGGESTALVPAGVFACDVCGETKTKEGEPFASEAAVQAHKGRAHAAPKNKIKQPQPTSAPPPRPVINFCPCCGTNIQLIMTALEVANGIPQR